MRTTKPQRHTSLCLGVLAVALSLILSAVPAYAEQQGTRTRYHGASSATRREPAGGIGTRQVITAYLPFVGGPGCGSILGETYGVVAPISGTLRAPAEMHPDINLGLRGYVSTTAELGLIDLTHPIDPGAPQLAGLFGDGRTPVFSTVYQVYDWDWAQNVRSTPILNPPVTLAGLAVTPGEIIRVPSAGYDLGWDARGYQVMVLYASTNRITLKYTREDDVVYGYTLHLEGICVEPGLLALYQAMNTAGRVRLPALYSAQPIGRAVSAELRLAIRDTGMFMEPRARSDWWQGR